MTLRITELHQSYGDNVVLKGLTFDVEKGKLVSVLGPNGSGKSTLIRTICGILKAPAGEVVSDDRSVSDMTPKELSKTVGYVPQKYVPSDYMKVFDAVLIGRAPYMSWSYSKDDFAAAERAIEKMEIMDLADRYINDLSGGQVQRVIIARALAQGPEYYLLDEPTSALDLRNQMTALRTVKDIISDGSSGALVALHDLNLAMRFSDTVVMLKDGVIHAMGAPADVITEENIATVYGVRSEIFESENGRFVHILEDEK